MARVYESNGPDVKIRGTAAHVMEKYVTLARDASSSGDPVAAESYYQHAEHYYRMIAASQPQMPHNLQGPGRDHEDRIDDDDDGEGDGDGRFAPAFLNRGGQQQSYLNGERGNGAPHGGQRRDFGPGDSGGDGDGASEADAPPQQQQGEQRPDQPGAEQPVEMRDAGGDPDDATPRRGRRRGRYRRRDEGGEGGDGSPGASDATSPEPATGGDGEA